MPLKESSRGLARHSHRQQSPGAHGAVISLNLQAQFHKVRSVLIILSLGKTAHMTGSSLDDLKSLF